MNEKTTWIIGADPSCDLVVDMPSVSRRHCRLVRGPGGTFSVVDLGSTNGTFVDGQRVHSETVVGRGDAVTLGFSVPMPWPEIHEPPPAPAAQGGRVVRVGREPDNDLVIDSPEVSGHHARVVIAAGGREGYVDDLGSTNGTAVGVSGPRVARAVILPGDTIFFGPVAVPAGDFFGGAEGKGPAVATELVLRGESMTVGRDPNCDRVLDFPVISGRHARFFRSGRSLMVEDLGSSNGTYVAARRIESATPIGPGDLIGLGSYLVRLVDGSAGAGPPAVAAGPATGSGFGPYPVLVGLGLGVQSVVMAVLLLGLRRWSTAAELFAVGMAALWVGLCAAWFDRLFPRSDQGGRSAAGDLAWSVGRAAVMALLLSALLMGLVPISVPASAHWPAAAGIIGLTALVGAAMGLAVVRASGKLAWGVPIAAVIGLVLGAVSAPVVKAPAGGGTVARLAAAAAPPRWCFEALSLLAAGPKADDPATDPVAAYFPVETDRTGPLACAVALLAMLGGLVYLDAVMALTRGGRPPRAGPASP